MITSTIKHAYILFIMNYDACMTLSGVIQHCAVLIPLFMHVSTEIAQSGERNDLDPTFAC